MPVLINPKNPQIMLTQTLQEFIEALDGALIQAQKAHEGIQVALSISPNNQSYIIYNQELEQFITATEKMMITFMEAHFPPSFHIAHAAIQSAKLTS